MPVEIKKYHERKTYESLGAKRCGEFSDAKANPPNAPVCDVADPAVRDVVGAPLHDPQVADAEAGADILRDFKLEADGADLAGEGMKLVGGGAHHFEPAIVGQAAGSFGQAPYRDARVFLVLDRLPRSAKLVGAPRNVFR
jgi:hypothetical protein